MLSHGLLNRGSTYLFVETLIYWDEASFCFLMNWMHIHAVIIYIFFVSSGTTGEAWSRNVQRTGMSSHFTFFDFSSLNAFCSSKCSNGVLDSLLGINDCHLFRVIVYLNFSTARKFSVTRFFSTYICHRWDFLFRVVPLPQNGYPRCFIEFRG